MYDQTRAQQPSDQPRGVSGRRTSGPEPLFPPGEREKIVQRLGRALNTFPDAPHESLEEAEGAFDEAVAQVMAVLAEQRQTLRASWQGQHPEGHQGHEGPEEPEDPESRAAELHLALRQYRELIQRLLRL
ncbi:hypothetical protein ACWDR3_38130 [Streptomyces sp. NPDC001002]